MVTTSVPVARIVPAEGVMLEGGDIIAAPVVISNADPRQTLRLLGPTVNPPGASASSRFRWRAAPLWFAFRAANASTS